MLFTLSVMLVIARHLGPEQFGQLSYLVAIVGLLAPFSAMGLNAIVTRELVNRPQDNDIILGSALAIRFVGAVVSTFIVVTTMQWYVDTDLQSPFVYLLVASFFSALLLFDYWLQAHVASRYAVKARMLVLVLLSVARFVAVYLDAPLEVFIWLAGAELALTGLAFAIVYAIKGAGLRRLTVSLVEASSLMKQSWWLILSGVAAIIYLKLDQVMLGQLSTDEQVGIYAVAARLSEVWYFFPIALVNSFFPKLLTLRKEESARYVTQLQKLNDMLFLSAFLVAIAVLVLGDWLIVLLFGKAYLLSGEVLIIHIWAGIFIFMRALLSKWLLAEDLLQFSLITQIAGAAFNVLLNWLLIPSHGATGAAIATVVSYAAASYLALLLNRKTWPMAMIMTKSMVLPVRALIQGKDLYR